MDPHEDHADRMYFKLLAYYNRIRQYLPNKPEDATEQLQDISPRRSSRIAAYVRTHKKHFAGGAAVAFIIALCGEIIRRSDNKS